MSLSLYHRGDFINAVGPRVGGSAFGLIPGFAYTAPFEDLTIKA